MKMKIGEVKYCTRAPQKIALVIQHRQPLQVVVRRADLNRIRVEASEAAV